jgi:hypothetical protein
MKDAPMNVVKEWTEFGHHFQVELLAEPKQVGAGLRTHRLWDNGSPASGGQWHYDLDGAVARAEYVLQCEYGARIHWLEQRVNVLERELHEAKRAVAEALCSK